MAEQKEQSNNLIATENFKNRPIEATNNDLVSEPKNAAKKKPRRKKNRPNKKIINDKNCSYCNKNTAVEEKSCTCGYRICVVCWETKLCNGVKNCPKCCKKLPSLTSKTNSSIQDVNDIKPNMLTLKMKSNETPKETLNTDKDSIKDPDKLSEIKKRQKYTIEEYHVKVCKNNFEDKCPHDFFKCIDCHEPNYCRRRPYMKNNKDQSWNYSSEMCTFFEKGLSCKLGADCNFCHSNDERAYHPDFFKITVCNFYLSNSTCVRGNNCFKSHGDDDFILLNKDDFSFESKDTLIKSEDLKVPKQEIKSPSLQDFLKMTVHNATTDTNFYMYEYKTRPCLNVPCNNMRCCTNYHHDQERRRSPKDFKYSAEPCPAVKQPTTQNTLGKWKEPSRCENLVLCEFSHTLLEQMYHPHIYKTSLCSNYIEDASEDAVRQNCLWGNLCTHAHGKHDLRQRIEQSKIFVFDNTKHQFTTKQTNSDSVSKSPSKTLTSQKKEKLKLKDKGEAKKSSANHTEKRNLSFSEVLRESSNIEIKTLNTPQKTGPPLFSRKEFSSKKSISSSLVNKKPVSSRSGTKTLTTKKLEPEKSPKRVEKSPKRKELGRDRLRHMNDPNHHSDLVPEGNGRKMRVEAVHPEENEGDRRRHVLPRSDKEEFRRQIEHFGNYANETKDLESDRDFFNGLSGNPLKSFQLAMSAMQHKPCSQEMHQAVTIQQSKSRSPSNGKSDSAASNRASNMANEKDEHSSESSDGVMNVKKYFSPLIGPNHTAIFEKDIVADSSSPCYYQQSLENQPPFFSLNSPNEQLEIPFSYPINDFFAHRQNDRHNQLGQSNQCSNSQENQWAKVGGTKGHEPHRRNGKVTLMPDSSSVPNQSDIPQRCGQIGELGSKSEIVPSTNAVKNNPHSFRRADDAWAESGYNDPTGYSPKPEAFLDPYRPKLCCASKPLRIVQDSPMYELYGDRRADSADSADSLLIDYKELYENLRKRYACPVCKSSKSVRDHVLVPCGHFFCNECVSAATSKVSSSRHADSIECFHCKEKSEQIIRLKID